MPTSFRKCETSAVLLSGPSCSMLQVDASQVGAGAVSLQTDDRGGGRVGETSLLLFKKVQRNYSVIEKRCWL